MQMAAKIDETDPTFAHYVGQKGTDARKRSESSFERNRIDLSFCKKPELLL